MGPTGEARVVQIHPTRRCNLRCLHCYSSSSPDVKEALATEVLTRTLDDIAAEEYNWVSFSGGEPLVYPGLEAALRQAKNSGLNTTLVTNGILLNEARLDGLADVLDLLVISLDGTPESHNRLRGNPRAFNLMASRLHAVKARQIPFGFLFTLTQHNLDELLWAVDFAVEQGARLLQIHPLENVGSAAQHLSGSVPDATEAAYAFLLKQELQEKLDDKLLLQLDLAHSHALAHEPARFFAGPEGIRRDLPLGKVLSPLVIESDGTVVPVQYGFPRRYALGNLHYASLKTLARNWRNHGAETFEAICAATYRRATAGEAPRFWNWYALLEEVAAEWRDRPEPAAASA